MKYFTAETDFPYKLVGTQSYVPYSIFLGGTIDDGASRDWQKELTRQCENYKFLTIFNPRDSNWDLAIKQTIDDPEFRKQVEWELDGLDYADSIFMYFAGGSRSIISMCELGLNCRNKKLIVAADKNYFKRGNIEVMAQRYKFPLYSNLDDGFAAAIAHISQKYYNDIYTVMKNMYMSSKEIENLSLNDIDHYATNIRKI